MPDRINVIRPDGSTLSVSPEEARKLEVLGYRPETPEQAEGRVIAAEQERYYTTTGQQVKAGFEGLLSGATLGLTDVALEGLGAETAERAQHNPDLRLATEIVGGVAPALLSGGTGAAGTVARATPAGRAAAVGERLGARVFKTSKAGKFGVAGVTEGVAQGVGAEVADARLNGDPITAESVLAAAGWGTLFGAGAGATVGGVAGRLEARAARKAAEAIDTATMAVSTEAVPGSYGRLRDSVLDLKRSADGTVRALDTELDRLSRAAHVAGSPATPTRPAPEVAVENLMSEASALRGLVPENASKDLAATWKSIRKAVNAGDPDELRAAVAQYRELAKNTDPKAFLHGDVPPQASETFSMPEAGTPSASQAQRLSEVVGAERIAVAHQAMKEATDLAAAVRYLEVPEDLHRWAKLAPKKAEEMFAALDTVLGTKSPELEPLRQSVLQEIGEFTKSLGVSAEGGPVQQLKAAWATARNTASTRTLNDLRKQSDKRGPQSQIARTLARVLGWRAGSKMAGWYGGMAGSRLATNMLAGGAAGAAVGDEKGALVGAVLATRAGTLSRIDRAVSRWGSRAGRVATKFLVVGDARRRSKESPLAVRLDGTRDTEGGTPADFAKRRIEELSSAMPAARDTLYRAVYPMDVEGQPEFAQALHKSAVALLEAIMSEEGGFVPRDPGTVMSRGRSFWRPTDLQIAILERALGVFHDPVGRLEEMAETGDFPPTEVKILREGFPALLAEFRDRVLTRVIEEPAFLAKMSYQEQVGLSRAIDVPLHSSMRPQFIAAQQAMFENQLKPQPPSPGETGAGVRGPDGSPMATQAQKSTERA